MSSSSDDKENKNDNDTPCYQKHQHEKLQLLYVVAILLWIFLTACYKINPPRDIFELAILLLPVVCFIIAFVSIHMISESVEAMMLKANLLTIGLLVALPLINWTKETSVENKTLFIQLAVTAIILSLITLIDWWVPKKYIYMQKHIKSILQTFAIVLLIFGLYRFFCESCFGSGSGANSSGSSGTGNGNSSGASKGTTSDSVVSLIGEVSTV